MRDLTLPIDPPPVREETAEQTTWQAGPHRELSIRNEGGIPVPDVTLPCAQTGCDSRYVLPTHRPDWAPQVVFPPLPSCSSEVLYAHARQAGWHLDDAGQWLCPSSRPVLAVPADMEKEREMSTTQEFHPVPPAEEPLIDPDCRDGKCGSCVGGPCEHECHNPPDPETTVPDETTDEQGDDDE